MGLLVGVVLLGDSLLIMVGIVVVSCNSNVQFDLVWVILLVIVGSILGSLVGYLFGQCFGLVIFNCQNLCFFKFEYCVQVEEFFVCEGLKLVLFVCFIFFVCVVVFILVGVSNMNFIFFVWYSVLGVLLWGVGLLVLVYFVGQWVLYFDCYILLIVVVVLVLSFILVVFKLL